MHFFFFPGTSFWFGYTANATGHRGAGGRVSQWTLAGLLYNLTTSSEMGAVVPPVTTSSLHVEAPLLQGPEGSVVTLLNWMPDRAPFSKNTSMLTVDVALGFKPSKVESVEHGVLMPVPGNSGTAQTRVTLPLASADFLLFHK